MDEDRYAYLLALAEREEAKADALELDANIFRRVTEWGDGMTPIEEEQAKHRKVARVARVFYYACTDPDSEHTTLTR